MVKTKTEPHYPVLLAECLHYLDPKAGESYLDLTAGYGGHAAAVMANTGGAAVLVDRDPEAVAYLKKRFSGVTIIKSDFAAASRESTGRGQRFDLILADLGVSSPHLEDASRGFSFQGTGPLDMRMDRAQELSARTIVNQSTEAELERILRQYGQEPKARAIARGIVARRPLNDTAELAKIAAAAWPGHSRVHPATRTFQALRIAVNDELGQLESSLPLWVEMLEPGGRLAVISFHSLEDRIVKRFFGEHAANTYESELRLLTKKPVSASQPEIASNPRARSAKLRAVAKIKK